MKQKPNETYAAQVFRRAIRLLHGSKGISTRYARILASYGCDDGILDDLRGCLRSSGRTMRRWYLA